MGPCFRGFLDSFICKSVQTLDAYSILSCPQKFSHAVAQEYHAKHFMHKSHNQLIIFSVLYQVPKNIDKYNLAAYVLSSN